MTDTSSVSGGQQPATAPENGEVCACSGGIDAYGYVWSDRTRCPLHALVGRSPSVPTSTEATPSPASGEPCPDCGCPGDQYDGHCCEEVYKRRLAEAEQALREARELLAESERYFKKHMVLAYNSPFRVQLRAALRVLGEGDRP